MGRAEGRVALEHQWAGKVGRAEGLQGRVALQHQWVGKVGRAEGFQWSQVAVYLLLSTQHCFGLCYLHDHFIQNNGFVILIITSV